MLPDQIVLQSSVHSILKCDPLIGATSFVIQDQITTDLSLHLGYKPETGASVQNYVQGMLVTDMI